MHTEHHGFQPLLDQFLKQSLLKGTQSTQRMEDNLESKSTFSHNTTSTIKKDILEWVTSKLY